jgi:hypothetical protein
VERKNTVGRSGLEAILLDGLILFVLGCWRVLSLTMKETAHQALATQKKLSYLGFQFLDHPPYSLDLARLDYHLFPGLKNQLKGN